MLSSVRAEQPAHLLQVPSLQLLDEFLSQNFRFWRAWLNGLGNVQAENAGVQFCLAND
jgi:hypothetical protein